jgi:hypothetical protein
MEPPMKKALFAAASLLALAACRKGIDEPEACLLLPYIPPSVQVTVQDSVTGANITPGSTLVLRSGAYVDSVAVPEWASGFSMGEGRSGTFTLTVRQTGYQSWTKAGITVESDECGAKTVYVTARLKP